MSSLGVARLFNRHIHRRMLIALRRKPRPPTVATGTHDVLGLEKKAVGDASLTRRAPVTAVAGHGSNVAVTNLTCNTNVRVNFVDVRIPNIASLTDSPHREGRVP